ncbi:MAG: 30S ribosomal protein S6 [Candidatus Paceibacterota bacterium]|jgi:ribosomal protein S6
MDKDKDKREYEVSFLVKEEQDVEKIKKIVSSLGLEISYESEAKRIPLAYPIKKEISAVFSYFYFYGNPDLLESLSKELNLEKNCLRFLVVTNPIKKTEARMEDASERRPIVKSKIVPQEKEKTETLSNEELEKKLEEILG